MYRFRCLTIPFLASWCRSDETYPTVQFLNTLNSNQLRNSKSPATHGFDSRHFYYIGYRTSFPVQGGSISPEKKKSLCVSVGAACKQKGNSGTPCRPQHALVAETARPRILGLNWWPGAPSGHPSLFRCRRSRRRGHRHWAANPRKGARRTIRKGRTLRLPLLRRHLDRHARR